jgi:carbonic anhydrase
MNNHTHAHNPKLSPVSLDHFLEALRNFRTRFYTDEPETMQALLDYGQNPSVLIIACSDSRVDPALLVNAAPGDLFVVRNVANLVPPYNPNDMYHAVGAAIEYAVRDLQVGHIIVMGHAHCGGIKALINTVAGQKPERDFIGNWVSIANEACSLYVEQAADSKKMSLEQLKEYPYLVERAAVEVSLRNLLSYPWLKIEVDAGKLNLHGWWFDLETGDLWATTSETNSFMPVN